MPSSNENAWLLTVVGASVTCAFMYYMGVGRRKEKKTESVYSISQNPSVFHTEVPKSSQLPPEKIVAFAWLENETTQQKTLLFYLQNNHISLPSINSCDNEGDRSNRIESLLNDYADQLQLQHKGTTQLVMNYFQNPPCCYRMMDVQYRDVQHNDAWEIVTQETVSSPSKMTTPQFIQVPLEPEYFIFQLKGDLIQGEIDLSPAGQTQKYAIRSEDNGVELLAYYLMHQHKFDFSPEVMQFLRSRPFEATETPRDLINDKRVLG